MWDPWLGNTAVGYQKLRHNAAQNKRGEELVIQSQIQNQNKSKHPLANYLEKELQCCQILQMIADWANLFLNLYIKLAVWDRQFWLILKEIKKMC